MYTRLVRDGRFCRPSRALQLRLCSLVVGILFGNGNDAGAEFTAVIYNCTGKRHPAHHRPKSARITVSKHIALRRRLQKIDKYFSEARPC